MPSQSQNRVRFGWRAVASFALVWLIFFLLIFRDGSVVERIAFTTLAAAVFGVLVQFFAGRRGRDTGQQSG